MGRKRKIKKLPEPVLTSATECCFCHQMEDSELGVFFQNEEACIAAHQFCLLFSSGLAQNGEDNEGFDGFLLKDIKKEVQRASKITCKFCKSNGASSGCNVKTCRLTYHYLCGKKEDSQFVFFDTFNTYCKLHRENQDMTYLATQSTSCPLCLEDITLENKSSVLKMPCCNNMFIHRSCIQYQAMSSGYFFKCPTCNNEESFQKEMARFGIYIPQRDASWEENNAFAELLEQYDQCDWPNCECPDGRTCSDDGNWDLLRCYHCGQSAVHKKCLGDRIIPVFEYVCPDCNNVIGTASTTTVVITPERVDERLREHKKRLAELTARDDPVLLSSPVFASPIFRKRFNVKPCWVVVQPLPSIVLRSLNVMRKISMRRYNLIIENFAVFNRSQALGIRTPPPVPHLVAKNDPVKIHNPTPVIKKTKRNVPKNKLDLLYPSIAAVHYTQSQENERAELFPSASDDVENNNFFENKKMSPGRSFVTHTSHCVAESVSTEVPSTRTSATTFISPSYSRPAEATKPPNIGVITDTVSPSNTSPVTMVTSPSNGSPVSRSFISIFTPLSRTASKIIACISPSLKRKHSNDESVLKSENISDDTKKTKFNFFNHSDISDGTKRTEYELFDHSKTDTSILKNNNFVFSTSTGESDRKSSLLHTGVVSADDICHSNIKDNNNFPVSAKKDKFTKKLTSVKKPRTSIHNKGKLHVKFKFKQKKNSFMSSHGQIASLDASTISLDSPFSSLDTLTTSMDPQTTINDKPLTSLDAPTTLTDTVLPSMDAQTTINDKPLTSLDAPTTLSDAVLPSMDAQTTINDKPLTSPDAPTTLSDALLPSMDAQTTINDKPLTSLDAPTTLSDALLPSMDASTTSLHSYTEVGQLSSDNISPVHKNSKPLSSCSEEQKPGSNLSQIFVEEQKPDCNLSQIRVEEQKPGSNLTQIFVEEQKPDCNLSQFFVEEQKPDCNLSNVRVEQQKTDCNFSKIRVEQQKPDCNLSNVRVEEQKPGSNLSQIFVEEQKPDCNLSQIVVEEQKPDCNLSQIRVEEQKPGSNLSQIFVEQQKPDCNLSNVRVEERKPDCNLSQIRVEKQKPDCNLSQICVEKQKPGCNLSNVRVEEQKPACNLSNIRVEKQKPGCNLSNIRVEEQSLNSNLSQIRVEEQKPDCNLSQIRVEKQKPEIATPSIHVPDTHFKPIIFSTSPNPAFHKDHELTAFSSAGVHPLPDSNFVNNESIKASLTSSEDSNCFHYNSEKHRRPSGGKRFKNIFNVMGNVSKVTDINTTGEAARCNFSKESKANKDSTNTVSPTLTKSKSFQNGSLNNVNELDGGETYTYNCCEKSSGHEVMGKSLNVGIPQPYHTSCAENPFTSKLDEAKSPGKNINKDEIYQDFSPSRVAIKKRKKREILSGKSSPGVGQDLYNVEGSPSYSLRSVSKILEEFQKSPAGNLRSNQSETRERRKKSLKEYYSAANRLKSASNTPVRNNAPVSNNARAGRKLKRILEGETGKLYSTKILKPYYVRNNSGLPTTDGWLTKKNENLDTGCPGGGNPVSTEHSPDMIMSTPSVVKRRSIMSLAVKSEPISEDEFVAES